MIGSKVRHWRIEERLSKAGMGEVYRAHDERLLRDVAIKFLPRLVGKEQAVGARFIREARAASALNHPNIVTIFEAGRSRSGRYIVMEFVAGRTLRQWASSEPGSEAFVNVASQIARALAAAHEAGIVHRDIKPENIMVRHDGYVKLVDFGLARWSEKVKVDTTQTVSGTLVGTLRYMSPEQAAGEPVQPATDIFSLGVVLYEVLTGHHPFDAATELEILQAISARPVLPLRHWAPRLPAALDRLVLRMLERQPWQRPAATDLVRSIENLGEEPVPVDKAGAAPRQFLVGRHDELVKLRAFFDAALSGNGLLALITGEPGIGKTSLIEGFLSEQAASGGVCAIGRGACSQRLAGAEAYLPLLEALEDLTHNQPSLAATLRRVAPNWYAHVFHKPAEPMAPSLSQLRTSSRELLNRELVGFLEDACFQFPVVLFLDDLHWADESTIDLLAFSSASMRSARILILATYRPEEMQLRHERFAQLVLDMQAHRHCRSMELQFLSLADVEALLGLEFTQNDFPRQFPRLLHARTEGNPFFIVEVLRYLRDKQLISQSGEVWTLSEKLPNIERDLPQSVIGMVQRKIELLSDADRRLLAAASIQGYEFDSPVVARTLSVDPVDVEERLHLLHRVHGVVQPMGEKELPDRTIAVRCRFVHYLYYSAFYNAIQPARKASWSATAAQSLIDFYKDHTAEIAPQIAYLFETARDFSRSAEYFSKAAEHAMRVFAHQEAELLARRGLRALEATPEDAVRPQRELDLLLKLGMPLLTTKTYGNVEVQEIFHRAHQLCLQLGENPRLFPALWGLETYFVARLDLPSANEISEHLLRLVQNTEDVGMLLTAHLGAGASRYCSGDFEGALQHFRSYRDIDHASIGVAAARRYGLEPGTLLRAFEGRTLWWLGHFDQCVALMREAAELARSFAHGPTLEFVLSMAATTAQYLNEVDEVDVFAHELIRLGKDQGMKLWIGQGNFFLGWARRCRDRDPAAGLELMRQGLVSYRATETALFLPHGYSVLASAYVSDGLLESAREVLQDAYTLQCTNLPGAMFYTSELLRAEGELLQAAGDLDQAEALLWRAVKISQDQRSRFCTLRAATSLARLLRIRGKPGGFELLTPIYESLAGGLVTPDLALAKLELVNREDGS